MTSASSITASAPRPSLLDRRLVDGITRRESIADLADRHALSEWDVIARVKAALASDDVFTEIENRKLLVRRLNNLVSQFEDNLDATDTRSLDSLTRALVAMDKLQSQQVGITDEELDRAARAQATLLVQVVAASWQRARSLLIREYPTVNVSEIDAAFNAGLAAAAQELEQEDAAPYVGADADA